MTVSQRQGTALGRGVRVADRFVEEHVKGFTDKVNNTFRTGYGTVLFFEDHKVIKEWGNNMPNYSKVSPPRPIMRPIVG